MAGDERREVLTRGGTVCHGNDRLLIRAGNKRDLVIDIAEDGYSIGLKRIAETVQKLEVYMLERNESFPASIPQRCWLHR